MEISKEIDDQLYDNNSENESNSIADEMQYSQPQQFNVKYIQNGLTEIRFRPINDNDRAFLDYLDYEPASHNFI